ncbi:carboxymuconolactone decarboxylase family protein [Arenibaculum pallidiluteum]|uniref:carboxymuconolactone decarboxylase family protein n=1 Tax=Arenibaculum pallidiluteum TaxID=2812559 RepID=UPI001A95FF89|nr:carboxymuconolactone decarboxylase family protein [Arenibaculum pallidiluteum]
MTEIRNRAAWPPALPPALPWLAAAMASAIALSAPAFAQGAGEDRIRRGEGVILELNRGQPQQTLEQLRQEFPFLADAIAGYALGEVWDRPQLDNRTRQIAAVSAFAALGLPDYMKIHAGYALNIGVSEAELKEIVYLTTVHAGFPRAIEAAQTLSELFAERAAGSAGAGAPR